MSIVEISGHTIDVRHLDSDSIVVDLGCNVGLFAMGVISRLGCKCYSAEPSPTVFAKIPPHSCLHVSNLAVAGEDGVATLNIGANTEETSLLRAENTKYLESIEIECKTLERFVADLRIKKIDLLKLDIEGSEIEVLDSCSDALLQGVGQITVEFHDFLGKVSTSDVERVLDRIRGLGFYIIPFSRSYYDVLAINRRLISRSEFVWLRYFVRNFRGLSRVIATKIGWRERR